MSRRRARWVRCSSASALEIARQLGDAVADLAPVELEAGFARALAADAAALAIAALRATLLAQARDEVLQPHDLDLGLGGAGARVAAEDLEDDRGAIEHLDAGRLFEVARLRRRDVVIDEDGVDARVGLLAVAALARVGLLAVAALARAGHRHQLRELAAADDGAGVERLAALGQGGDDLDAQGGREAVQLRDRGGEGIVVAVGELDCDHGGAKRDGGAVERRHRGRGV